MQRYAHGPAFLVLGTLAFGCAPAAGPPGADRGEAVDGGHAIEAGSDAAGQDTGVVDARPADRATPDGGSDLTEEIDASRPDQAGADQPAEVDASADAAADAGACRGDPDCALLDDGDLCNGTWACVDGACRFDPDTVVVCDPSDDTDCTANTCAADTGACAVRPRADRTPCDDGEACTHDDACRAGQCVGLGRPCAWRSCPEGEPACCMPVVINGPAADKLDLVIVPDGYSSDEDYGWFLEVADEVLGLSGEQGLLNIEPFASARSKLNIYYVNSRGPLPYPGSEDIASLCPAADEVMSIFNFDHYVGTPENTGSWAITCEHFGQAAGKPQDPLWLDAWEILTFSHEFGHSFGCLRDLYTNLHYMVLGSEYANVDVFGCPKWCDGEPLLPEPTNAACEDINDAQDCIAAELWPRCTYDESFGCLPLSIDLACKAFVDPDSCASAYSEVPDYDCHWDDRYYDGYCVHSLEQDPWHQPAVPLQAECQPGYGCYQGAHGLGSFRAEATQGTVMGYETEARYDIASLEHLTGLLEAYVP